MELDSEEGPEARNLHHKSEYMNVRKSLWLHDTVKDKARGAS